jgi:seryl-tRNA synthetase
MLQAKYDKEYAHALKGTYVAAAGIIVAAIVEHYLHKNFIKIPEVLHKYTKFTEIEI